MKTTLRQDQHIEYHSKKRNYVSGEKPEGTIPIEEYDFKEWAKRRAHIVDDPSKPCQFI